MIGKLRQEDQTLFFIDIKGGEGDDRVKDKELEKLEKYQLLKYEIAKVWRMQKVIVVPVLLGPLEPYQSTLRST